MQAAREQSFVSQAQALIQFTGVEELLIHLPDQGPTIVIDPAGADSQFNLTRPTRAPITMLNCMDPS